MNEALVQEILIFVSLEREIFGKSDIIFLREKKSIIESEIYKQSNLDVPILKGAT